MEFFNVIIGIIVAAVGILMEISPSACLAIIVVLLGVGAVAYGVFDIIKVRLLSENQIFRRASLIQGLLSIVIGMFAVALPLATANAAIKVVLYVLGVYFVIGAASEIFMILKLSEEDIKIKGMPFQSIAMLILGVLMFILPSQAVASFILRICGIFVILGGSGYAIYSWKHRSLIVEPDDVRDDE